MTKNNIYFPNLNGVRCIAALMVIISHLELNKSYFNLENHFHEVKHLGRLGVSLFFVLSGFLITYLLIKEKEVNGRIKISFFYWRRVLRIWPLYYFIVLLSLFVLPKISLFHIPNLHLDFDTNSQFFLVCVLFICFLSNLLISIKLVPFATQTWSIGTEEQFYFVWPLLINKISNLKKWFLSIIVFYNVLLFLLSFSFLDGIKYITIIRDYSASVQLDSLTIGALGAYYFHKNDHVIKRIANDVSFVFSILVLILALLYNFQVPHFNSSFYAFLFITIILNLVYNKRLLKVLEFKPFTYLGKISYGLYMYHQIMIVLCINILLKFDFVNTITLYILSIISTVIVAGLSYEFLEKPFLKMKYKWSIFNTSTNPKTVNNISI
jgi:peptidoglycan/LPS O-acetylase OafA/YrhL